MGCSAAKSMPTESSIQQRGAKGPADDEIPRDEEGEDEDLVRNDQKLGDEDVGPDNDWVLGKGARGSRRRRARCA